MNNDDFDDPVRAFERLRGEVSLCLRAIQGLTAERQKMPDYSETLKAMDQRLHHAAYTLQEMAKLPAMRLTPDALTVEINRASEEVRQADRQLLNAAHRGNADVARELRLAIQQVKTAKTQRWYSIWAAFAGAVVGMLLLATISRMI